jgi:hypothetical protein
VLTPADVRAVTHAVLAAGRNEMHGLLDPTGVVAEADDDPDVRFLDR